jgi:hypothetical protein
VRGDAVCKFNETFISMSGLSHPRAIGMGCRAIRFSVPAGRVLSRVGRRRRRDLCVTGESGRGRRDDSFTLSTYTVLSTSSAPCPTSTTSSRHQCELALLYQNERLTFYIPQKTERKGREREGIKKRIVTKGQNRRETKRKAQSHPAVGLPFGVFKQNCARRLRAIASWDDDHRESGSSAAAAAPPTSPPTTSSRAGSMLPVVTDAIPTATSGIPPPSSSRNPFPSGDIQSCATLSPSRWWSIKTLGGAEDKGAIGAVAGARSVWWR